MNIKKGIKMEYYYAAIVLILLNIPTFIISIFFLIYIKKVKFVIFFDVYDRLKNIKEEIKINIIFKNAYDYQVKLLKKFFAIYKYWSFLIFLLWISTAAFFGHLVTMKVDYFSGIYDEVLDATAITWINFFIIYMIHLIFLSLNFDNISKKIKNYDSIIDKYLSFKNDCFYLPDKYNDIVIPKTYINIKKYHPNWFIRKYKDNTFQMYYFFLIRITNDNFLYKEEIHNIILNFLVFNKLNKNNISKFRNGLDL
ncbi:hypothetical protein RRG40_04445 [Mycoplasmopsis felis]|uniref:hypothetical protein n=1 Tax=Mycoplasmopsis felis TaxID=33923 RepID=UPI002AFE4C7B|nr:hypothetical protein [Mycoplasmopsis felis]WQQ05371.1 hypothetical protein RRG59_03405 [Mycoplasmopsis felis]